MKLKTLTWAEITVIVVCIGFMTFAAVQRFLPVEEEVGFAVESIEAVETAITDETDEGHFVGGKLCLNSATAQELEQLPGIGETLAARIIEYREENGPFQELEELDNVYGIGESIIEGISEYLTLEEYNENSGG